MLKIRIAIGLSALLTVGGAWSQVEIDIKSGDSVVPAMVMGSGEHVVIALHGGSGTNRRFFFQGGGGNMGQKLAHAGFRVIALNWSGHSGGGFSEIAIALAHARETGARKISLMGHSRGGELAVSYALQQADGTFDSVIQFSSSDDRGLPMTRTKKLFAYSRYDPIARFQPMAFDKSVPPKQKIEVEGVGHGIGALVSLKADLARDVISLLRQSTATSGSL